MEEMEVSLSLSAISPTGGEGKLKQLLSSGGCGGGGTITT